MSERYQREIEEILQQVGESVPTKEPGKAKKNPLGALFARLGRAIGNRLYPSSGRLVTIAIVLLLSAILVSAMYSGLLGPLMWLGLILFILVYALFFARPKQKMEKMWRGRSIEQQRGAWPGEGLWGRLQRWLRH